MATPKMSIIKSDVHHLGKKPLPEIHFHILKGELRWLWSEGRKNRYEFGKKCKQLQDARAHAKNGTYMRDLAELRIPYHTAQRAIKFYLRVKKATKAKLLQIAKDKEWFTAMGIEDVDELDRLQEAQQADSKLAELVAVRDKAMEQVYAGNQQT
jgi:viroplasmin and RNaseH domain-containing protein